MTPAQSPTDHLRSLERAIADLAHYPGLGPEIAGDQYYAELAARIVPAGAIVPYVNNTRLRWQDSTSAIGQTILDAMDTAGFQPRPTLENALRDLADAKKTAPRRTIVRHSRFSGSARDPFIQVSDNFWGDDRSTSTNEEDHIDIGSEWTGVQDAARSLAAELNNLLLNCLRSGRVIAVERKQSSDFFMPPDTWKGRGGPKAKETFAYLLTCTLPPGLSSRRSGGAVLPAETTAEQRAIALLNLAYEYEPFKGRRLTKKTASPVLQDCCGVSENAVHRRIWPATSATAWQKSGAPTGSQVTEAEFRAFITDNRTTEVGE